MSAPEDIRLSSAEDIRESVRQRYADAAQPLARSVPAGVPPCPFRSKQMRER